MLTRLFDIKWKANTPKLPNSKLLSRVCNPPREQLCFLCLWRGRSGCCVAEGMFWGGSTDRTGAAMESEPGLGFSRGAWLMFLSEVKAASVVTEPRCAGAVPAPETGVWHDHRDFDVKFPWNGDVLLWSCVLACFACLMLVYIWESMMCFHFSCSESLLIMETRGDSWVSVVVSHPVLV